MGNFVTPTDSFERKVKRLLKKFQTLQDTLFELEDQLIKNPFLGQKLGNNIYKVRVADKSKGKGKSGGFRIITYLVKTDGASIEILLLTIFDKSESDTIENTEIKEIIKEVLISRKK
jgi:mRNA-degrading endonuclease RelE of RelBE toxin-antitoxin system